MRQEAHYKPPSEFLRMVIADEIPFVGAFGERNLKQLISLTKDPETSNRDWATMLLSQLEFRRPDVEAALRRSADDPDNYVRAEAIVGLAAIESDGALELIQRELKQEKVAAQIFEAAALLADPSLINDLEDFQEAGASSFVDGLAHNALVACKAAQLRER